MLCSCHVMICTLTSLSWMGNNTKRPGFSFNKGSSACLPASSSNLCLDTCTCLLTISLVSSRESTDDPDETLGESAGSGDTTAADVANDFAGVLLTIMRLLSSRLRVMLNSLLSVSTVMILVVWKSVGCVYGVVKNAFDEFWNWWGDKNDEICENPSTVQVNQSVLRQFSWSVDVLIPTWVLQPGTCEFLRRKSTTMSVGPFFICLCHVILYNYVILLCM